MEVNVEAESQNSLANFEFITGKEWQLLDNHNKETYINKAFSYWRYRGFPFPTFSSDEVCKHFRQLQSINSTRIFLPGNELASFPTGLALANYFHPQIWSVSFKGHRTPMQCFFDDNLLKACLRQALTLWPDRKGASERCLRDMLRTYRHTRRVSNFRPTVAKALYDRYSKPGDKILDFCAGYGGRLLGCLTLPRHYIGYDPCKMQVEGLKKTYKTLMANGLPKGTAEIREACAEDEMLLEKSASFDLIFTSPPYFNLEKYSNEHSQSYIRYPSYSEWREKFLSVVVSQSHRLLKPGGYLILNVLDSEKASIATDTLIYSINKFSLLTKYQLRLSTLPFHRVNGTVHYHFEPVFVFLKT